MVRTGGIVYYKMNTVSLMTTGFSDNEHPIFKLHVCDHCTLHLQSQLEVMVFLLPGKIEIYCTV